MTTIEVQKLSEPAKMQTRIVLNDDVTTILTQRIIAGNSLYLFLLDEQKEITVLPIENVKHIHYAPLKVPVK